MVTKQNKKNLKPVIDATSSLKIIIHSSFSQTAERPRTVIFYFKQESNLPLKTLKGFTNVLR